MTATRSGQRPGAPKKQVDLAVQKLRDIYDDGLKLRDRLARAVLRGEPKMAWIEREAAKRDTNRDYLWKAMMFADPETGVSHEELNTLCRLAKENGRIVGRALVAKLVSIPKSRRMKLAEDILRRGLTLSEIDAMLTQRYGRRRQGGRRPRMLGTKKDTLFGLDKMCVSWERLTEFLKTPPESPSHYRGVRFDDLPDDVRISVQVVDHSIQVLRQALAKHLR